MRIVQLIDSLEAGGAERMAVNYANALSEQIEFSGLISTRKEGALKESVVKEVNYLYLKKTKTLDFKAVFRLRKYLIKNKVQIIQAHSSSFFLAVLVKLTLPKMKIIWHDHYGNSDFVKQRPKISLQLASFFFNGIIAVNETLKTWSLKYLRATNVLYLPNFVVAEKKIALITQLKGNEGKRIICLANLRVQKNHLLLLEVAQKIKQTHPDWSFHLVGKDFKDAYSKHIKEQIIEKKIEDTLFLYDSCSDITAVLQRVQIGVLTSISEGLPVALLEYGMNKIPVVVTNVGQIASVVIDNSNGFLVPSNNKDLFFNRLCELIESEQIRNKLAENLNQKVVNEFSAQVVIKKYLYWLQTKK